MRFFKFFMCCYFFPCCCVWAQDGRKMSFQAIQDGLFNQWISTIKQDAHGFIWVGTQDGLHRYDGYRFEVLRNSPEDSHSLAANWICDIAIDTNDNYWIGTYGGGLSKFSPKKMNFENFDASESLGKLIFKVAAVGKDHIISSSEKGFQLHNTHTNTVRSLGLGNFSSPLASKGKMLWLAEDQNLFAYDLYTQNLTPVYTFESNIFILKIIPEIGLIVGLEDKLILFSNGQIKKEIALDAPIMNVTTNGKGTYFMATHTSLLKFDAELFGLEKVNTDLDISKMLIRTIFLDRQESLWVGTDKGLYKEKKVDPAFLQENIALHARRIVKHKEALYIGGLGGLFRLKMGSITALMQDRHITALIDDGETILASASKDEIYIFKNDSLYATLSIPNGPNAETKLYGLAKDRRGRIWVGAWDGLHVFDEKGQYAKLIPLQTASDSDMAKIINIHIDTNDRLWVITCGNGLYMIDKISDSDFDIGADHITNYAHKKGDSSSLTSNIIITLEEDAQGQMWFGTDIGVVKYQEKTRNFSRLKYQDKLFDKKVMVLRKEANQNLWITTINDGIYVYDNKENTVRHFTKNDGLVSNAFLFGSGVYDESAAHMYFGTDEGVQIIDVSKPFSDKKDSAPIITAFQVNGEQGKAFMPPSQAPFLQQVSLTSSQNDFSIRFSAMDFIAPEKVGYVYSLDDNWKTTDLQTAYFTNVPYGHHELKVRTHYEGIPSGRQVSKLKIFISPPWYYSNTAKISYLLLLFATIWGIYRYLRWRWKMQLNLQLTEEETNRLKKLDAFKSRLYTDIAHEFKTPLTLIAGPVDHKLRQGNISDNDFADFSMVSRNANRLTALVDQLLQLAKLENGNIHLKVAQGNLGLFLNMLSSSFEYQARLKQIEYVIDINMEGETWYDEDILEKIVSNLLSNAFKYTPGKGKCRFVVEKDCDTVQISVKNTVSNSSQLQLDKLFTRFYQNDSYSEGMGVGLALVKELVSFYGGSVHASLEEEETIHFQVRLPIRRDGFNADDILQHSLKCNDKGLRELTVMDDKKKEPHDEGLPILLIVEDHAEIRAFVVQALQKDYQILEAENGKIGLDIALAQIPDIILSDVRMPLYSGIELCNALKADERTSHIPIVLLTANTSEENELKGLASGADDFVTKPFKIRILERRIANLICQRKILRNRYSQELVLKPKEIAVTPADEALLGKIQQILDEHLNDPSFNAAVFCKKANMSRMQLHRKLLAFTGLSTSAFLRSQRLKQAEHLLQTSDMTINEVAYATGFNTPTYFMKCFKETFKKTPTGYLQSLSA